MTDSRTNLIGKRFELNNPNLSMHGCKGTILRPAITDNNRVAVRLDNSKWVFAFKLTDLIIQS